ncbi:uncharacterized protein A1O9_10284 [Exophiala aquamarina CBS 119918]|uniref:Uncharacterized protein n=1 Tax=Exophiala aquamarina CBS 119918 TaxID=1182545 RepID=A0A072P2F8_9EURO|nr:uncharacterized protein A1O9_10284 [Exophiala aquamarina CBS 119918]KEF53882.1 hypothetical protein A1O9_10284 [Exophiala aquamarina CBS 119918]
MLSDGVRQINAVSESLPPDERGILQLSEAEVAHQFGIERNSSLYNPDFFGQGALATLNPYSLELKHYRTWASTVGGSTSRSPNMSRLLYPTLPVIQPNKMSVSIGCINLFQGILNTTNSPALALQAGPASQPRSLVVWVSLLKLDPKRQMKKGYKQGKEEFQSPELLRSIAWHFRPHLISKPLAWMKPLTLQPLMSTSPYDVKALATEALWQPYPKRELEVAYYPFAVNEARFRLYVIAADLLPLVLCGNPEDSPLPGHVSLDTAAKFSQFELAWSV